MIRVENLNITLPGFKLRDIGLAIDQNEFFVLMGPTGAGKTVLLEAIAGLVPVKDGRVFVMDREITHLPPEKREVGIVYQDHALFPHLTVLQNIMYGLRFRKIDKGEAKRRCGRLVDMLNLSHILGRIPTHLSGGEKQRVSLARALIVEPSVILLDEPLTGLDPNFREEVRNALKRLHQSSKATFLMVTHDFSDALFLSKRAAVINQGRIEQSGNITDVFHRPISPFVAEFVGMKNVFQAKFGRGRALLGDLEIDLGDGVEGAKQYVAIRPEDIIVSRDPSLQAGHQGFRGIVIGMVDSGFYHLASVRCGSIIFHACISKGALLDFPICEGTEVWVQLRSSRIHTF